ncbi:hypothetical protein HAZT_HAZT001559 [Hyalella azteca]|uniref:ABC transporter domain-containing protein n=1 Tax=Hyalella azteca TaxID=294128 RepID=A0A6A0GYP5_HYAAZ|nr:hypothetical protein HAZT_HAZT001559 [Hyalella azteca]
MTVGWQGADKGEMEQTRRGLASSGRKFLLLLWKNWLLQRRNVVSHARVTCSSHVYPQPTLFPTFSLDKLPDDLKPPTSAGFFDGALKSVFGTTSRQRRSLRPLDEPDSRLRRVKRQSLVDNLLGIFGSSDLYWPVAYTPNDTGCETIMRLASDRLYPDIDVYGFASEAEMVKQLTALALPHNTSVPTGTLTGDDYLAGIVFMPECPNPEQVPASIEYKIRMKGSLRSGKKHMPFAPPPQWLTELVYPLFQVPGPRERNSSHGPMPGYYDEGYLPLQHAIDMSIAELYSGGQRPPAVQVEMGRMPYPPYTDDKYLVALQAWLPLILLLSYLYPATNIVKNIVHEKEKKLKESMKMMGLPNYLHWAAWFVKSFIFLLITTLLITILLCTKWQGSGSLAVLHKSDPSLVLAFLCVYLVTVISFCFLLSTLFSRANIAATVTGLLWIFAYLPNEFLRPRYGYINAPCKLVLCFFFKIALGYGCQLMSMFEGTGAGAQWHLLFEGVSPDDPLTLGHVMLVMMLDAVVYALLAWYIEAVFPGEFGVPQPWNFPFLRSYWLGADVPSMVPPPSARAEDLPDPDFFEPDPVGQQIGIRIKGLTKVFKRGNKVAVNKMNLNMYNNQMTVLLGHNGAGKTTTMSMLTGLFPPSSGTAVVNGYDIVKEMAEVRRSIGICPQHDVLFDELTVSEHIQFFSILKGLPRADVEAEVQSIVTALKLKDKVHAQSYTLSGGMKRKLSVGIALCAGSKVVILDEPTSGMDPGARRLIWDLLQKAKQGRTLLLTTHFMEEADLLGDRIAIMALGVVQCCGSSMFLKKRYGSGYHLVLVKQESCDVAAVTATIQKYIKDARVDQNHGAELSYVLPNEDVAKFEQLFNELEQRREELKVSSYGASQTTMDEVFLRVGENAEQREQLRQYSAEAAATNRPTASSAKPHHFNDASSSPLSSINGAILNAETQDKSQLNGAILNAASEPGRARGKQHARTGSSVSVNSMKMQLMREIEEQAARDIAMKPEKGLLLQPQPTDDFEEAYEASDTRAGGELPELYTASLWL